MIALRARISSSSDCEIRPFFLHDSVVLEAPHSATRKETPGGQIASREDGTRGIFLLQL